MDGGKDEGEGVMNARLERYLDEVAARLGPMPTKRRDEELREMRGHLQNAVLVHREWGQSEDEAARTAVEEFGPPEDLGAHVVRAWKRGRSRDRRSFWGAVAGTALGVSTLPYGVTFVLCQPVIPFLDRMRAAHLWYEPATGPLCFLTIDLPGWLLVGTISGRLFPRRAGAGAGVAMAAWVVLDLAHRFCWEYVDLPDALHGYFTRRRGAVSVEEFLTGLGNDLLLALAAVAAARRGSRWQKARVERVRLAQG